MIESIFVPIRDSKAATAMRSEPAVQEVVVGNVREVKFDVACCQSCRAGIEGAEMLADAQHRVNLRKFAWPWANNPVHELHCSHAVEHITTSALSIAGSIGTSRLPMKTGISFSRTSTIAGESQSQEVSQPESCRR